MTCRPLLLLVFFVPARPALSAQGDEPPALGLTGVSTPSGLEEQPSAGLQMLSLPLESRTSITDYVGRNLPGAFRDSDGRLSFRGARPEDTAVELDGLRLRSSTLPLGLVERLDVASAGYGAAWSDVLGGVVGATTRSGSNRFHADVDLSVEGRDPARAELAPSVSGPILRDRLFYVVSISGQATRQTPNKDVEGILSDVPGQEQTAQVTALKLTFLPRRAHRLEALGLVNAARTNYGGGLGTEPEAQPAFDELDLLTALRWTGTWDRLVARSQVAFQRSSDEELPFRCRAEPTTCDQVPPTILKFPRQIQSENWSRHQIARESEWQLASTAEARLLERPWIQQRVRATSRVSLRTFASRVHRPGDRLIEFAGPQMPEAETVTFTSDPRVGPPQFGWHEWSGSLVATNHSLEAETRLFDRLWIVPGLALAAARARTDYLTLGAAALTPHLGLAWDAFGNGRTWVRASTHQRAGADLDGLVLFNQTTPWQQRCSWNPDTMSFDRGCVLSGGGFGGSVGFPCGASGVAEDGTPCGQPFHLPRSWEHTLSVDHELGAGIRTFAELVYRRPRHLPYVAETNLVWDPSGISIVGFRNRRQEQVRDYSTTAIGHRYLDVTVGLHKDMGALRVLTAFTYNSLSVARPVKLRPTADESTYFWDPTSERPYAFRAMLSYDLWNHGSVGLLYRRDSGAPYQGFLAPVASEYRSQEVRRSIASGFIEEGDRPRRTPDLSSLNLQLRFRTKGLLGPDFHIYADLINILGNRAALVEERSPYAAYVQSTQRWLRLGLEYRH